MDTICPPHSAVCPQSVHLQYACMQSSQSRSAHLDIGSNYLQWVARKSIASAISIVIEI